MGDCCHSNKKQQCRQDSNLQRQVVVVGRFDQPSTTAKENTLRARLRRHGVGASPSCDGQILVTDDMIGLFDWPPKFVRRYGAVRDLVSQVVQAYAADVRSGTFPGSAEMYTFKSKGAAASGD